MLIDRIVVNLPESPLQINIMALSLRYSGSLNSSNIDTIIQIMPKNIVSDKYIILGIKQ